MKKVTFIVLAAVILAALPILWLVKDKEPAGPAPNSPEVARQNYQDITAKQLSDMLAKKDFYLINVHVPYEGEIRGTDTFIPYNEITGNDKLPADKTAKIILYCRTGRMSTEAAASLAAAGYKAVYSLSGGMAAWEKQGYEIINK